MSGPSSAADARLISTERGKEAIYHALQLCIGRGRQWSCDDLAFAMRQAGHVIEKKGVQAWVAGNPVDRKTPPSDVLLKLFQLLGKDFTSKVIGAIGQGAYSLTPALVDPASVVATLAMVTHRFAHAGIDLKYDNAELGELEPVADAGIAVLEPFSSRRGC